MEKIADLTCLTEYQGCVRKGTCVAIIFLALAFSLGSSKSVNILNLMEPTAYFTVEKKRVALCRTLCKQYFLSLRIFSQSYDLMIYNYFFFTNCLHPLEAESGLTLSPLSFHNT